MKSFRRKPLEELQFSDDFMFCEVMKNEAICQGVLERLLMKPIGKITYPELQKVIKPYYTKHGIRMDVYTKTEDELYDIEMQIGTVTEIPKRTRYYQSMLDADNLLSGQHYSELKDSFVLFITVDDPFNLGLPVYTFTRRCHEMADLELGDKSNHIIYNCAASALENDPERRAFMEYVKSQQIGSDFTEEIDKMVASLKLREEFGRNYAGLSITEQDAKLEGFKEGKLEGAQEKTIENAINFLNEGVDPLIVAKCTGLNLEQVQQLAGN